MEKIKRLNLANVRPRLQLNQSPDLITGKYFATCGYGNLWQDGRDQNSKHPFEPNSENGAELSQSLHISSEVSKWEKTLPLVDHDETTASTLKQNAFIEMFLISERDDCYCSQCTPNSECSQPIRDILPFQIIDSLQGQMPLEDQGHDVPSLYQVRPEPRFNDESLQTLD